MRLTEKDYHTGTAKVWYLEMHKDPHFLMDEKKGITFSLLSKPVDVNAYRHYYRSVGFQWNWLDRLAISDEELSGKINAGNIEIFAMKLNDTDAGYAEFAVNKDFIEIMYFGLFPDFVGKGFGKFFLKWVINKAWSYNPQWIQLNTCSLDHPNALGVYQSAGFNIVKHTVEERKILNTL